MHVFQEDFLGGGVILETRRMTDNDVVTFHQGANHVYQEFDSFSADCFCDVNLFQSNFIFNMLYYHNFQHMILKRKQNLIYFLSILNFPDINFYIYYEKDFPYLTHNISLYKYTNDTH